MKILLLFKYQSKLYNCVLARNIRIKTKAPVKLTGAPLLGLAKSIYYGIKTLLTRPNKIAPIPRPPQFQGTPTTLDTIRFGMKKNLLIMILTYTRKVKEAIHYNNIKRTVEYKFQKHGCP